MTTSTAVEPRVMEEEGEEYKYEEEVQRPEVQVQEQCTISNAEEEYKSCLVKDFSPPECKDCLYCKQVECVCFEEDWQEEDHDQDYSDVIIVSTEEDYYDEEEYLLMYSGCPNN